MIHITNHESGGKMEGFQSINLWCECDKARRKNRRSVCSKCYWYRRHRHFPNMVKQMKHNLKVLSKPLKWDEVPWINAGYFRFSSFGDISKSEHVRNFIRIAEANPHCQFGWWTKRYDIIKSVQPTIPKNLVVIVSSPDFNEPDTPADKLYADKTFTVWDEPDEMRRWISDCTVLRDIECSNKCKYCFACYHKNRWLYIHERVK